MINMYSCIHAGGVQSCNWFLLEGRQCKVINMCWSVDIIICNVINICCERGEAYVIDICLGNTVQCETYMLVRERIILLICALGGDSIM